MKNLKSVLAICLALTAAVSSSYAAVVYDETVSGDLSGLLGSPTSLSVSSGANTVIGEIGANGNSGATNGSDADYFSLTVPSGGSLDTLTVDSYVPAGSSGSSFFGYTLGTSFSGQGFGDVDGFTLINAASGDVLSSLAGGSLGPGTYSFWLQETAPTTVEYQLTIGITTTVIPEPATAVLISGCLAALVFRRRR